ncbi:MAG TPA: M48 family metallopeptidase [Steroidobacteraceae bacterium]|jgi:Zn-dependent protease with chaperone function|nr:M48 family metallopeptidase [Steroidobacteraceae bacterium]
MNFFKRQDEARRASRRLVVLFGLAVVAVVAAVDFVVFLLMRQGEARAHGYMPPLGEWLATHPQMVVATTLAVLAVITTASFYKTLILGGGGGVVARSLGGVRISPDTTDPQQRRLLNVVEEMAIASGVPMPEVYLLEQESGINAFAAGHNPSNAAIGVTRGTLTTLNRTELQGVIAHEFSHILNGDMKLNVRLMGLLFGLLVIALIGRTVLRGATRVRGDRKGGVLIVLLIALAVLVIGYVGLFFGRLIQAAVSRSRESLADASAVQFTRDPSGLRGALIKIGASAAGSRVGNPEVEEVAHMLFAPGMSRFFATHPPLLERLKDIDPHFDPKEIDRARASMTAAAAEAETPAAQAQAEEYVIDLPAAAPAMIAQLVGNPGTAHMQLARGIRQSLPEAVVAAGRHAESARALLLALALDSNPETRARQKQVIAQRLTPQIAAATAALERDVDALEPEQRSPTLMRGFPALRQLTHEERVQLMACLNGMLPQDGSVALHSYVLRKLAQMHLRDDLNPGARVRRLTLDAVQRDAQVLFSVLARHGHSDDVSARRAYEAGMHQLFPRERPAYGIAGAWAAALDLALSRLDQLAPIAKEQLVEAMVATVTHDQQLTIGEAELLRAVCASVHCPLPPLVAT